ncbi:MAG: hypothetical protein IJO31_02585, partial [Oscillospiraceae bacterium]|nr:hypothetical protein [Oscillospiraceae bacterium]
MTESFSPQEIQRPWKYIQYFRVRCLPCEKKSFPQNCEALQSERFYSKTREKTMARLTPAMVFLRSIAGKD